MRAQSADVHTSVSDPGVVEEYDAGLSDQIQIFRTECELVISEREKGRGSVGTETQEGQYVFLNLHQ